MEPTTSSRLPCLPFLGANQPVLKSVVLLYTTASAKEKMKQNQVLTSHD